MDLDFQPKEYCWSGNCTELMTSDKNSYSRILEMLPYGESFLFVDKIIELSDEGIRGVFTFKPDLEFYSSHFKDQPVTPGVILTECCAQIGLACLGIHLLNYNLEGGMLAFSHSDMEFYQPVFPDETVEVVAEKEYFRFGKLKVHAKMYNQERKLVCKGTLSGMLKSKEQ